MYLLECQDQHAHKGNRGYIKSGRTEYGQRPACGEEHGDHHGQDCAADQAHHRRLQAGHSPLDQLAGLKPVIAFCNNENNDKAGHNHAHSGAEGSEYRSQQAALISSHNRTYIGGHIHCKGAGSGLTHRNEVDQRFCRDQIAPTQGNLLLDHRQHGVAAAEGHGANHKEGQKQLQKTHFFALLSIAIEVTIPNTAQPMITKITLISKIAVRRKLPPMTT